MDFIKIKDLEVYANHGLFEEENKLGQKFLISAEIGMSFRDCAIEKNLDRSIDYGKLSHELYDLFKNETEDLIETLAYKMTKFIFDNYEIAETVDLTIKKSPWSVLPQALVSIIEAFSRTLSPASSIFSRADLM